MARQEFTMDTTEFNGRMTKLAKTVEPKAVEKGLAHGGIQLMNDAIMQQPTVPKEEGTLRGSGSVFVNNKHVQNSPREGRADPNLIYNESRGNEAVVGFNTPYAARLHEHPEFNFKEPSSGAKYLEVKMTRNKKLYLKIIAGIMKEAIEHA